MTVTDNQLNAMLEYVKDLVDEAETSSDGLRSVAKRLGGISYSNSGRSHRYALTCGIAARVLPSSWEYSVVEACDGVCEIIVTRM